MWGQNTGPDEFAINPQHAAQQPGAQAMSRNTVESLERRDLFSWSVAMPAADTLVLTGDWQDDRATIYDNGNGVISGQLYNHAAAAYVPLPAIGGIRAVYINAGKGDDSVSYQVTGDRVLAGHRFVSADMSYGNDVLMYYAGNDIDTAANSAFDVRATMGDGNDTLRAYQYGELDGYLGIAASGGEGDDILTTEVRLQAGSTGKLFATSFGDAGKDTVNMLIRKDFFFDPVTINSNASGGADFDTCNRTFLATNDATCEVVNIVP
jgi:hypothetical protein